MELSQPAYDSDNSSGSNYILKMIKCRQQNMSYNNYKHVTSIHQCLTALSCE